MCAFLVKVVNHAILYAMRIRKNLMLISYVKLDHTL